MSWRMRSCLGVRFISCVLSSAGGGGRPRDRWCESVPYPVDLGTVPERFEYVSEGALDLGEFVAHREILALRDKHAPELGRALFLDGWWRTFMVFSDDSIFADQSSSGRAIIVVVRGELASWA